MPIPLSILRQARRRRRPMFVLPKVAASEYAAAVKSLQGAGSSTGKERQDSQPSPRHAKQDPWLPPQVSAADDADVDATVGAAVPSSEIPADLEEEFRDEQGDAGAAATPGPAPVPGSRPSLNARGANTWGFPHNATFRAEDPCDGRLLRRHAAGSFQAIVLLRSGASRLIERCGSEREVIRVLSHCYSLLAPGGTLLLEVPTGRWLRSWRRRRERAGARAGAEDVSKEPVEADGASGVVGGKASAGDQEASSSAGDQEASSIPATAPDDENNGEVEVASGELLAGEGVEAEAGVGIETHYDQGDQRGAGAGAGAGEEGESNYEATGMPPGNN